MAVTPTNLAFAVLGCFLGTIIGALPGIGPVNGVAILIPIAFALKLDPTTILILLSCIYYGCTYGGRIASIMLNIPGDASSIMATLDGHPMAKAGKASEALAISAVASFIGSSIATLGLTLFAPFLAKAAIYFGPSDYFALYVLAFAMIGGIGGANPWKMLLAGFVGLMLATVGLDPGTGLALEKQRARLDVQRDQQRQHHGRGAATRDAERQHGYQRPARGGVVACLGRGQAARIALAERVVLVAVSPLQHISHECALRGAGARQDARDEADERPAEGRA